MIGVVHAAVAAVAAVVVVGVDATVQAFDSLDQFLGQRRGRLENQPTPRVCRGLRAAIEVAEPGDGVHERPIAIDEVRYPERAIAQEYRHFAALAEA